MPIDPITGNFLLKSGSALAKYGLNRLINPGGFDKTGYGSRLKILMERGAYTPQMKSTIVGGVSKPTADIASRTKSDIQGQLIQSGAEGSIAGSRRLKDVESSYMTKVADTARAVEFENEKSKARAREMYEAAKGEYESNVDQMQQQQAFNLINNVVDAGTGYFQGQMQKNMKVEDLPLATRAEYYLKGQNLKLAQGGLEVEQQRAQSYQDKINADIMSQQPIDFSTFETEQDIENYILNRAKTPMELETLMRQYYNWMQQKSKG